MWHYVEDYNFYRIEYTLDGYWHKIYVPARDIDCDIPTFICRELRADLDCVPEERFYR